MRRPATLMTVLTLFAAACSTGSQSTSMPNVTVTTVVVQGDGGAGGSGGSVSGSTTTTALPSTTEPAPTTTAAPSTTTTTQPPVETGSREVPLPAGTPVTVGNWEVMVLGSTLDATTAVLAENSFNDDPDPGDRFSMVQVAVTYLGEGSASPFLGLTFGAVGDSAVAYGFEDDCGVTPDAYPGLRDVFPGGTVAGNLCWGVREDDLGTLVLLVEAAFTFDPERFFLEIPTENVSFDAPVTAGIMPNGGATGSRGNPIRSGDTARVGSWEITVLGSTPDATDQVVTENTFNDPPGAGRQFFLVEVEATNRGIESESAFSALSFSSVGPGSVAYSYEDDCGVVPDPFPDFTEVFAGGTITGNLCWEVTSSDTDDLLLIVDAAFSIDDERTFFEIP